MRVVEDQGVPAPRGSPPWLRGSEGAGAGERMDGWDSPTPCDLDRQQRRA